MNAFFEEFSSPGTFFNLFFKFLLDALIYVYGSQNVKIENCTFNSNSASESYFLRIHEKNN